MLHDIDKIIKILREISSNWQEPIVTEISKIERNPYKVLISTIISLRTKDEVTRSASDRLYKLADTPETIVELDAGEIEKAIYPAGFYKNKAKTILEVSKTIIDKYEGIVPDDLDELLTMKGVGRKTANLVLTLGYGIPGICVDTHVHRISNRFGYVSTKNPNETEFALREKLPPQYWIEYNDLLVSFGQNMCRPISPLCSQCPIHDHCMRIDVKSHR
ncbi:endonuclease III domain-containing protein [Candidatus Latescibacterota bacterium]